MSDADTMPIDRLRVQLVADDSSVRLEAAMAAGSHPDAALLPELVARCAVEPDFYVRDMLTWAIIQLPLDATVPALRGELSSPHPQARSQALHTLSKIGTPEAWEWVFPHLLGDADDEVARSAWRLAAGIVPRGQEATLTSILLGQVGRGDLEVKKSLARAFVELAPSTDAVSSGLHELSLGPPTPKTAQAQATLVVVDDPGASFAGAYEEALRRTEPPRRT